MLQELAAGSGTGGWVIASMLFFVAVYAFVAVRAWRMRDEDVDAKARLALDDGREKA